MVVAGLAVFGGASLVCGLCFSYGLGWTLPSIGSQTVVAPARAGEAAGINLTVMVTIAGVAVALAGTLIDLENAGIADIIAATGGVVRLVSVLSLLGGAALSAIALIGRRIPRPPSEATSLAS